MQLSAALAEVTSSAQPGQFEFQWWSLSQQQRQDYVLSFFSDMQYEDVLAQVSKGLLEEAEYLKTAAAAHHSHQAAQLAACWHPGAAGVQQLHMCDLHQQHGHRCAACVAYAAAAALRQLQQQPQQQPQPLPTPPGTMMSVAVPAGGAAASSTQQQLQMWLTCRAGTQEPTPFLWVENGAVPGDTECQVVVAHTWRASFWRRLLGQDFLPRLQLGAGSLWQLTMQEALQLRPLSAEQFAAQGGQECFGMLQVPCMLQELVAAAARGCNPILMPAWGNAAAFASSSLLDAAGKAGLKAGVLAAAQWGQLNLSCDGVLVGPTVDQHCHIYLGSQVLGTMEVERGVGALNDSCVE
jgi:hypothetical protein